MKPRIAIVAPGAMGSAIGARLAEHGVHALTSLEDRSRASADRAHRAGMAGRCAHDLAQADLFLSIVPPGQAVAVAQHYAPLFAQTARKPVYLDCNAVSPATVKHIAGILAPAGVAFVDGALIGAPPRPAEPGPTLYLSGPMAAAAEGLGLLGLRVRMLGGDIGAASALKMSYAGITKGLLAIAATMLLGASRSGAGPALLAELADSQPDLLRHLARGLPDMYGKAYRWEAEMQEIAAFLGQDDPGQGLYESAARVYRGLAGDHAGARQHIGALDALLAAQVR